MVLKASILDETTEKAVTTPRLRMNYNIHDSFEDSVQRMFNALEPGTIVPVARHPYSNETLIMLRGKRRLLIYDEKKHINEDVVINPYNENVGF